MSNAEIHKMLLHTAHETSNDTLRKAGRAQRFCFVVRSFHCSWVSAALVSAEPQKQVQQITIRSGWGGLGNSQDVTVSIRRMPSGFQRDGKPIEPRLVQALVSSLEAPRIVSPEMENLGITESWLKAQVHLQKPESFAQATKTTAGQQAFL